jgi:hypothetical protein
MKTFVLHTRQAAATAHRGLAAGVVAVGAALPLSMAPADCLAQTTTSRAAALSRTPDAQLIERLSESQLKVLVLRCSQESSSRALPSGEAAFCSVAWESLKKRSFAGDSDALLAWWRVHRNDAYNEFDAAKVVRNE